MKRQEKNNKGFSLTELVVVVAILGIISVGGIACFGLLHSASAKEASTKLNSALNKTRTECMSKASASVEIYQDKNDSKYYVIYTVAGTEQSPILIGSSRVSMSYKDSKDEIKNIGGDNKLVISFDRDTGAFQSISEVDGELVYCREINIVSGHKTYVIQCERLTGKTIVK